MGELDAYLQATELCDFDREPLISERAADLTAGCADEEERFDRIYRFVKEFPYGLEDWDVRASETLRKGWGMCCGKTNLLVAMARASNIPARYKVFRIRAESKLLGRVAQQDSALGMQMGDIPLEQDHPECEAYLGSAWNNYDPSRDSALEGGLGELGIPLEREPVADADGVVRFVRLASIDEWAKSRQQTRRFREGLEAMFAMANEQLEKIRQTGREA